MASSAKTKTARTKKSAAKPESPVTIAEPAWAIGNRVTHRTFGDGVVTAIDGDSLTIKFSGKVSKIIYTEYVTHHKK